VADQTEDDLPWPAADVAKAKRIASAAGWSEAVIRGFLNGLADLPGPPVDLVAAISLAAEHGETKWTRPRRALRPNRARSDDADQS
jgi:hypothetical protein